VADFYAGLLHPLTAPEHLLAFIALGLLLGRYRASAEAALTVFIGALVAGGALALWLKHIPGLDLVNLLSILGLGALLAADLSLPAGVCVVLALVFGLSHGFANGLAVAPPIRAVPFLGGLALAGLVVGGYGWVTVETLLQRNLGWLRIAVRVAGSWLAAIGILVLAGSWKQLFG
jgi:urease accessory protein